MDLDTPTTTVKPTATSTSDSGIGGFFSSVFASATSVVGGAIESEVASVEGDIDKLAKKLGIHQFYSLHLMDACEGDFTPNATVPGAGYNVTNCTAPLPKEAVNITGLLDHELSIGPIHINLADLKLTQDLQDHLNEIPSVFLLIALPYLLGAGFAGVSMLLSLAWIVRYETAGYDDPYAGAGRSSLEKKRHPNDAVVVRPRRWLSFFVAMINLFFAFAGAVALGVGSGICTVTLAGIADSITLFGRPFGITASTSGAFARMTWAAFGLMAAAMIYWAFEAVGSCLRRRSRRGLDAQNRPPSNGRGGSYRV